MPDIQFETPENVPVHYTPAGLGTRYVAWFVDQILVWVVLILLFIGLMCAGASLVGMDEFFEGVEQGDVESLGMYVFGVMMLVWGLGSFLYFGMSELFLRGQTIGKRMTGIRVVKADGFALDASSILVRNVFRLVDHLPPLWIVPVLSARSQRMGDMVAGTVVIGDELHELSSVRTELAERSVLESEFRFDVAALRRLSSTDLEAVERILERWDSLPEVQQEQLLNSIIGALLQKLKADPPAPDRRVRFLEDLLAAELRYQRRGLG